MDVRERQAFLALTLRVQRRVHRRRARILATTYVGSAGLMACLLTGVAPAHVQLPGALLFGLLWLAADRRAVARTA